MSSMDFARLLLLDVPRFQGRMEMPGTLLPLGQSLNWARMRGIIKLRSICSGSCYKEGRKNEEAIAAFMI